MHEYTNTLHPLVLKWLNLQGWTKLHDIQRNAIPAILEAKSDLIISAATASGKTEAALLPALSKILSDQKSGIRIIYISPLKALINDQNKRLDAMCQVLKLKATPWHGDIANSTKNNLFSIPDGILLITPESLESLMINHHQWCKKALNNLSYFIIDEFHAFIGSVRGYQLLSQLHRIDTLVKRKIPRIALSATLSNIEDVKVWLRPNSKENIGVIQNTTQKRGLKLQIRGFRTIIDKSTPNVDAVLTNSEIIQDIFRQMRGSTNLIFTNSRAKTEYIAQKLSELSEQYNIPNEFFPHHGSLAKDLRENLETRLKEGKFPTTVTCTQTLELGIDISNVNSVAQVDAPQSVSSLRQRLGRSGRRNQDAILRLYVTEKVKSPECDESNSYGLKLRDLLFDQTFISTAMIELVLNRWVEPPPKEELSLSTLVQQIISVIAQYGSLKPINIWRLLCQTGPFYLVSTEMFAHLLKSLGANNLITQLNDGTLTLGIAGEKLVSNYNFFSSFKAQEEYIIEFNGKKIGTIPLNQPLSLEDTFIFAGKSWEVTFVDSKKRVISVKEFKGKTSPLILDSGYGYIHDGVRQKTFELYKTNTIPLYLNNTAKQNFIEGQKMFQYLKLDVNKYIVGLDGIYLFPWLGDKAMFTIIQLLKIFDVKGIKHGSYILIPNTSTITLKNAVNKILESPEIKPEILSEKIKNLEFEKYDTYLTKELLYHSFASRNFDIKAAMSFFNVVLDTKEPFDKQTGAAYLT
jgi:ATP-dependent Lhr-like helicase